MAEIVKTVRIETGNGERTVKSLRKEISDLRDALLNMDKGGEDWVKTAQQITKAQEVINSVMKAGKEVAEADATSIAGMEARYKSLYSTFKLLSQEQRKSAEGISMQKELAELSKNLNETKKAAGNFKDNIGHYADDMMSAFSKLGISVGSLQGPFKLASLGANGFKGALDILAKHPVLLTLTALVALFTKVAGAIKQNEELQLRMNKAAAAFKPIGDAMAFILDKVAGLAVKVAEGLSKVVTWVNNLFGATKKLSEAELALADSENALIKQRREMNELNSSDEARIQELMEEASITDDMREKEKLLTEAKELQEKVNKRNVELAQAELNIIKQKNAITPSSTEDLNKQSEAQVKVNQAMANGERTLRRINNQLKSTRTANAKAADEAKKELDEILKRLEDNTKTEIQKLTEKYEKELALLKKYHKDTTALEKEYQTEKRKIELASMKEGIQAQLGYYSAMASLTVAPSNAGFEARAAQLQGELKVFEKAMKDMLGIEPGEDGKYKIDIDLLINADTKELTDAGREFSEAFGLGLQNGLSKAQVGSIIKKFLADKDVQKELLINEEVDWKREIAEMEMEISRVKGTLPPKTGETLEERTTRLGKEVKAEADYYAQRAALAESWYEQFKDKNEQELNEIGYTLNDKLNAELEYYNALAELRANDLENERTIREGEKAIEEDRINALHELKMTTFDSISSIAETYKVLLEAYKEDGKISEREAKKKAKTLQWLEGIQGAAAVAAIVADTASGWMSINKALAAEYVLNAETAAATGPAAAATKAALDAKSLIAANIRKAAILVNGIAAAGAAVGKTVAAIKGLGGDTGDEGGSSASAAPQLIDSTPYSYTRELQTDVEREEQLNTPIYVRVTDIETAQAQVRVRDMETTF